jgi:hypothetical protein
VLVVLTTRRRPQPQLQEKAAQVGIDGRSKMSRGELVKALRDR